MAGLQDLPVEIILEIVNFTSTVSLTGYRFGFKELCDLRLVSQHYNNIISPILFSTLRLEFRDADNHQPSAPNYTRCQEIIKALATRSTTVFGHTKKLYLSTAILYSAEREDISAARASLSDNIFDAMRGLKSLRTLHWKLDLSLDPEEVTAKIIHGLGTLSSFRGFEDLRIRFSSPFHEAPSFILKPLSKLTVFRAYWEWRRPEQAIPEFASLLSRCPELTELSFHSDLTRENHTLHEIFSEVGKQENPWKLKKLELRGVTVTPGDISACIHHFKHLTSLGIYGTSRTFGGICDILHQNKIALKDVSTDHPDDPLFFHYLSSYSGLTSLQLKVPPESYHDNEVAHATFLDELFMQVIPNHAEALEYLELEWFGLPTTEGLAGLIKCQKLKKLQVSFDISNEALQRALSEGDTSDLETWFEAGMQLPSLTHLFFYRFQTLKFTPDSYHKFRRVLKEVGQRYRTERGMKFRVDDR
ncbi:hypothetical protein Agabi119p4_3667 [Agaricus bisporus var. burnettii]|uniref:F-box domain-containing protein n=1 Tax=Agaricus bisporus var. burnettii TaxID=192524 RepID=A0A8H7KIC4_AGABI|nr:hypothetical protein Agabi119p4_3667 [Agaricus bisporus var. burnettii]